MNIYNKHIITVNINGKALANLNLLAFAYVISLFQICIFIKFFLCDNKDCVL